MGLCGLGAGIQITCLQANESGVVWSGCWYTCNTQSKVLTYSELATIKEMSVL